MTVNPFAADGRYKIPDIFKLEDYKNKVFVREYFLVKDYDFANKKNPIDILYGTLRALVQANIIKRPLEIIQGIRENIFLPVCELNDHITINKGQKNEIY